MQMTYDGSILTIRAIWHYDLLQPVRRHQSMMSNDSRSKEKWNEKQQPLGGREDVKFGHLFYSKIAPNLPWAMERGRSGQKLRICGPEWQLNGFHVVYWKVGINPAHPRLPEFSGRSALRWQDSFYRQPQQSAHMKHMTRDVLKLLLIITLVFRTKWCTVW